MEFCNKIVDLPIPGSPEINTTEPRTNPLPKTLLNSLSLNLILLFSKLSISVIFFTTPSDLIKSFLGFFLTNSSSIEFHDPHLMH